MLTTTLKRLRYWLCKNHPAHDFNDYELGKRNSLPIINIFNKNAEVLGEFEYIAKAGEQISKTITAPADYAGLERFEARKN